ncbi:MAG: gamma-glutamylcyclotransferase family protein [Terriglobia bacterium]
MSDILLFQYGSNLDPEQKEARTGPIREARPGRLPGYRLAFNKHATDGGVYANIVQEPAQEVWGVVYRCTPDAVRLMDEREGVPDGHYRRVEVTVRLETGELTEAMTYVAGHRFLCPEGRPNQEYLNRILRGARHHELPEAWIKVVKEIAGRV